MWACEEERRTHAPAFECHCVWHIGIQHCWSRSVYDQKRWLHCIHSRSLHFVLFFNALSFRVSKNSTENLLKYHVNIKCILLKVRFFSICYGYVCRFLSKTSIYRRSVVNDTKSSLVCIEWFVVCPGTSFTFIFLFLSDIWNPNISGKQFITWIIIID